MNSVQSTHLLVEIHNSTAWFQIFFWLLGITSCMLMARLTKSASSTLVTNFFLITRYKWPVCRWQGCQNLAALHWGQIWEDSSLQKLFGRPSQGKRLQENSGRGLWKWVRDHSEMTSRKFFWPPFSLLPHQNGYFTHTCMHSVTKVLTPCTPPQWSDITPVIVPCNSVLCWPANKPVTITNCISL